MKDNLEKSIRRRKMRMKNRKMTVNKNKEEEKFSITKEVYGE